MSNAPTDKSKAPRPKKGEVIEVDIDALAFGGDSIGRRDGYVVFTKYGAPGDRAKVRVYKAKSSFGEGDIVEITKPSPDRIDPVCPLFGTCGGCSWQHLPIEVQRQWKERIVRDSIRPLPDSASIQVDPLVASPNTFRYRNKAEFTFARRESGELVAGFHKPGNWKEILDVEKCWLMPESMERVLRTAVVEGERQRLSAWNPLIHQGTLRQLVFRYSEAEHGLLAQVLTADREMDFEAFADALMAADPALKGVSWGLNSGRSDVARASESIAVKGDETIEERLGDLRFRISLASFFQTNTKGAERLYSVAKEALQLTGKERLLDAYCGTGTIGLFCADQVAEIYGIELITEAIWDARDNAVRNGVKNAVFMAGDMRDTLPLLLSGIEGRVDRLVVDPPRSGMEKKALEQLVAIRAQRAVYVSCNPTTMARDLQAFLDAGYTIEKITPVDMFPQTYHVECVASLVLKGANDGASA